MGCCLSWPHHRLASIPGEGCDSHGGGQAHEICSVHPNCHHLITGRLCLPFCPVHHTEIWPPIGNDSGQRHLLGQILLGLNSRAPAFASSSVHLAPPPT